MDEDYQYEHFYNIDIEFVYGGCIVSVGCQRLVYDLSPQGKQRLIADFAAYINQPDQTAKRFLSQIHKVQGPTAEPREYVQEAQMSLGPASTINAKRRL